MINENDRWICGSIKISLSDIQRARDLRILLKSVQVTLADPSKKNALDQYETIRERVVLISIKRELHKREQKLLLSDLEIQ